MERDLTGPEPDTPGAEQGERIRDPEPETAARAEKASEQDETSDQTAEPRPATGNARVDEALSGLDALAETPVAEHPEVFERIHSQLVDVLGELHPGSGSSSAHQAD